MRLTALLASLAFVALAFAGCSDGGDDDDGTTTTTTSTSASQSATSSSTSASSSPSSSSSSSTTTTAAPANQPPSGSISAAVNGTAVTFSLTGSDADEDSLTWTLAFGDGGEEDGTDLPATVEHTYAVGNYTANFTIGDGTDSVSYEVAVAAVAGGAGATSFVFTGDVEQDCATPCELATPVGSPPVPLPGSKGCVAFKVDMPGLDCIWTPLTGDLVGLDFVLDSTAGDADVEFLDACDPVMGASIATFYNAGPEAGVVPDGAGCAVLWEFNPAPSTITLTVG